MVERSALNSEKQAVLLTSAGTKDRTHSNKYAPFHNLIKGHRLRCVDPVLIVQHYDVAFSLNNSRVYRC